MGVFGGLPFRQPSVVGTGALKSWLKSKSHMRIMAVIGAVLLVLALLAAMVSAPAPAPQVILELDEDRSFYAFPPFIAELKPGPARGHVIHIAFTVEVPERQQTLLEAHQGMIENALKARLRAYDRRSLEGNTGADRLRGEILAALHPAIAPAEASTVLFRHLILE